SFSILFGANFRTWSVGVVKRFEQMLKVIDFGFEIKYDLNKLVFAQLSQFFFLHETRISNEFKGFFEYLKKVTRKLNTY
ncbi:MAG: hypothetical protein Q8R37_04350, partial [Nanoarchaeota archaeon]|nr:hypothetical protein [Nanoarchaeota archaeon]